MYFRLKSLNDGVDSLSQYTNGLSEEQDFVAETQGKIQSQPPLSPVLEDVKKMVQPTLVRISRIHVVIDRHVYEMNLLFAYTFQSLYNVMFWVHSNGP